MRAAALKKRRQPVRGAASVLRSTARERHGEAFRAVADPTRRAVLDLLRDGERTVSELCAEFDVTQPAISQHLKVLRETGLVSVRRDGRVHYYKLEPMPLREVARWVEHYEQFWDDKLQALGRFLDEQDKR